MADPDKPSESMKSFAESAADKPEPPKTEAAIHPSIAALKSPTVIESQPPVRKPPPSEKVSVYLENARDITAREPKPQNARKTKTEAPPSLDLVMRTPLGDLVRSTIKKSAKDENIINNRTKRAGTHISGETAKNLVSSKDTKLTESFERGKSQGHTSYAFEKAKNKTIG